MRSLRQAAARLGAGWGDTLGRGWGTPLEGRCGDALGSRSGFADALRRISSQTASTSAPSVTDAAGSATAKLATGRRSPLAIYSKLSKAKLSLLVVATAAGGAPSASSSAIHSSDMPPNAPPDPPERRQTNPSPLTLW